MPSVYLQSVQTLLCSFNERASTLSNYRVQFVYTSCYIVIDSIRSYHIGVFDYPKRQ